MEIIRKLSKFGKAWSHFHGDLSVFAIWRVDSWRNDEEHSNYEESLSFHILRFEEAFFRGHSVLGNWSFKGK